MTHWENYDGADILYIDFSNLHGDALINAIEEARDIILSSQKEKILEIVDITNSQGNQVSFARLIQTVRQTTPKVHRTAIIGITPLKESLLNSVLRTTLRKNVQAFVSKQTALIWLTM